ncbi:MAG: DUF4113 domain-containing protein [Anaerolineaceae bacterium]|nr:DUF4113 domain-containing protein [Anaerolineaceae bacterium]
MAGRGVYRPLPRPVRTLSATRCSRTRRPPEIASSTCSPPRNEAKEEALMKALDSINQKYGAQTLFYASSGVKQHWQMMRQMKSPHYTTRWDELLSINLLDCH